MDSTLFVNAAEIRKSEFGQKLIVLLKENSAQLVSKNFLILMGRITTFQPVDFYYQQR